MQSHAVPVMRNKTTSEGPVLCDLYRLDVLSGEKERPRRKEKVLRVC